MTHRPNQAGHFVMRVTQIKYFIRTYIYSSFALSISLPQKVDERNSPIPANSSMWGSLRLAPIMHACCGRAVPGGSAFFSFGAGSDHRDCPGSLDLLQVAGVHV